MNMANEPLTIIVAVIGFCHALAKLLIERSLRSLIYFASIVAMIGAFLAWIDGSKSIAIASALVCVALNIVSWLLPRAKHDEALK